MNFAYTMSKFPDGLNERTSEHRLTYGTINKNSVNTAIKFLQNIIELLNLLKSELKKVR